jgi:hypothetical protein
MSPAPKEQRVVTVWRHGGGLRIEPAAPEALRALLAAAHRGAQAPGGTYRVVAEPLLLGAVKADGDRPALYARPALEPVVRHALTAAGYRVERIGRPPRPLPDPQLGRLARLGPVDHGLLRLVQQHEWGLIRYAPGPVDPAWLVAQITLGWPELTVAAVARRLDDVLQFAKRLRAFLPAVTVLAGRGCPTTVERVTVSTYQGLACAAHKAFDVAWVDVVVAVDAVEATLAVAMSWLSRAVRARLYGLLAADVDPAPLDRDHMTCLFGFAAVSLPRHAHRERAVRLLRHPVRGGMPLPAGLAGVALQRRGVWQHAVRNRQAARIAAAFAAGTAQTVLGPAAADAPPGVVVLAANAEHALVLAAKLPDDWLLLAGSDLYEEGLTPEQVRLLHRPTTPFRAGPLSAVATPGVLANLDLASASVLVRADGGVGLPPLAPAQLIERDDAPDRPLVLLDFQDGHHPELRRRARQRREAYLERGWFAPGVDPVQARAEQFLASRPAEGLR